MSRSTDSNSALHPFPKTMGRVQWTEKSSNNERTLEGWALPLHLSEYNNQYWVKLTLQSPDTQQSLLLKIPCDSISTSPNKSIKQNPEAFTHLYIQGANNNAPETEERIKPVGDIEVTVDESTGNTTLNFEGSFTDTASELREIKCCCEWPATTLASQHSIFKWTEGQTQYKTEGWLAYSNSSKAWYLTSEEGEWGTPQYREWAIYIYCDDENEQIIDETFKNGDEKSNFYYAPFGGGTYEGEYNVTLTLTQQPLRCEATFKNKIRDRVEMTNGTFQPIKDPTPPS